MKSNLSKLAIGSLIALFIVQSLIGCTPTNKSTEMVEATEVSENIEAVESTVVEQPVVVTESTAEDLVEEMPQESNTLVFALNSEPDTLDAHKTILGSSFSVMYWVGGSLLTIKDGKYYPYLAESWTVSEDGLTIEFVLKHGVKFHDGKELTAKDWAYTFNRAIDPETASPAAGSFLGGLVSAEAVDDYTLRLNMSQANASIFYSLTSRGYLQPLEQEAVESMGEQYGRSPIGVGPYTFKEWVTGDHITLQRNPDYTWGPETEASSGPYQIEYIEFRFIPEYATQEAGLEAGEIDSMVLLTQDVERIQEIGIAQLYNVPSTGFLPYIAMNVSKAPFDDVNVRKALSMAIDREALVGLIIQGYGEVQNGPISSATMGYYSGVEELAEGYDLEKAKQLMADSGYILNADGVLEKDGTALSFTLYTISGEDTMVKTAQAIQSSLKELGFDLQIQNLELGTFLGQLIAGDYEIAVSGIGYEEADILYMAFHSSQIGVLNYHFVNDPDLDALLDQERSTMDQVARQEVLDQIQTRMVEQVYMIPLFAANNYYVMLNRVKNVTFNPLTNFDLSAATIEE